MAELDLDFDEEDDALDNLNEPENQGRVVTTVAGHEMPVLDEGEKTFYDKLRDLYTTSYEFTDPSDISDLDRILTLELTSYRLSRQLGQGHDQHGIPLTTRDISSLNRSLKEISVLLGKSKDDLGLSKSSRDAGGEEDPGNYLMELRKRALAFGIHRNRQVNQAIAELQDLISICQTWLRSNDLERSHTDYRSAEDIVNYVAKDVAAKVEELDTHFRENGQSIWVGKI